MSGAPQTTSVHKIMRESVYNTWNDGKTAPRALWLEMNRAPRAHPSPPPAEPPPIQEPTLQALERWMNPPARD